MSREIKFRVWSEEQKTYRYKFPYNSIGDFYVSSRGKVFSDFGNTIAPEVRQEAFMVEQYTGLKDKNGKEIYEGDIVNLGKYGIYAVVFNEFWCGFEFDGGKGVKTKSGIEHPRFSQDWQTAEVIGNIHENPELLGGEE